MIRRVAAVLAAMGAALLLLGVHATPVSAETVCSLPCLLQSPHKPATPSPTVTPSPSESPTQIFLPTPSPGGTLPPTSTPAPPHTAVPVSLPPLPSGAAPEIGDASPSGVAAVSVLPSGKSPDRTENPIGGLVLTAFLVCAVMAIGSLWLFFKLR